jgi:hypothetical protein
MGEEKTDLGEQLDESWNASIENLRKSAGLTPLAKAAKEPPQPPVEEEDAEDEDEGEEDEEEEGEEAPGEKESRMPPQFAKKSMEEAMEEEPEAVSAMDVEPFLRQFVKAFDLSMANVLTRLARVEKLQKAQAEVSIQAATLQKSMSDLVQKIGGEPVPRQSVLGKAGSQRFNKDEKPLEKAEFFSATHQLLLKGQLSLNDAELANTRVRRGTYNPDESAFDRKIQGLIDGNKGGSN